MQFHPLRTGVLITGISILTFSICAAQSSMQKPPAQPPEQPKEPQTKEEIIKEAPPLAHLATPGDYLAPTQVGKFTLAAEFDGHSVPTPQAIFNSEEYVVVEAAFFGPPDAKLKLSLDDFSLRINGKKGAVPSQSFVLVVRNLKDPDWSPPEPAEKQSKTSIGGGGGGSMDGTPPPTVHMPIALKHTMELRTQKASMPEGERALPQAGLLYFPYRGKAEHIQSLELIYDGPAGSATLPLQP